MASIIATLFGLALSVAQHCAAVDVSPSNFVVSAFSLAMAFATLLALIVLVAAHFVVEVFCRLCSLLSAFANGPVSIVAVRRLSFLVTQVKDGSATTGCQHGISSVAQAPETSLPTPAQDDPCKDALWRLALETPLPLSPPASPSLLPSLSSRLLPPPPMTIGKSATTPPPGASVALSGVMVLYVPPCQLVTACRSVVVPLDDMSTSSDGTMSPGEPLADPQVKLEVCTLIASAVSSLISPVKPSARQPPASTPRSGCPATDTVARNLQPAKSGSPTPPLSAVSLAASIPHPAVSKSPSLMTASTPGPSDKVQPVAMASVGAAVAVMDAPVASVSKPATSTLPAVAAVATDVIKSAASSATSQEPRSPTLVTTTASAAKTGSTTSVSAKQDAEGIPNKAIAAMTSKPVAKPSTKSSKPVASVGQAAATVAAAATKITTAPANVPAASQSTLTSLPSAGLLAVRLPQPKPSDGHSGAMSPKNSTSTAALKSLLSDAAPADQTAAAKASSSQTGQSSAGSSSADAAKVSAPAKGVAGKPLISSPVARVRTGDATPVNAQDKTRDKTAAKSAGKSAANSPNLPPASTTKPDVTTKKTPSAVGLSVSHAGSSGVSRNQPQSAETGKTTKTSDAGSGSKTLPAVSSSSCLPATATSIGGSSRSKPTGPKQTPSPPAASASVAPVVRQRFRPAAAAAPPTATIATPCSADKEAQERAHRYHLLANALNDTPAPSRPATVAAPPTAAVAKIESEANDNSMDSMSDEEYRQLYFPNAANTTNAVNAANTSMPLAHGTAANTSDGQGNTQLVPMDVDDPHTVVQPKAAKDPDDDVQPMQVDDSAWHAFQRIRRMIDEKPFRHPAINPRPRKYWGYLSETLYLRYSPFQFEREPNPDNPSWERKFRAATCPCKPVPVMDPAALKWTLPGLEPNQFPTRDW